MERAIEIIQNTISELYTIATATEDDKEKSRLYKAIDVLTAENNAMYLEYLEMTEAKAKELFGEF